MNLLKEAIDLKQMSRQSLWFLLTILVLVLDQATKTWVIYHLVPYEPLGLWPILNLTLAFNTGAAFGFLSQSGEWHPYFFMCFGILMTVVLVILIIKTNKKNFEQSTALSLILGGCLGNLVDRFQHGFVIDFIDLYYKNHHWYIFNLADSAICLGAMILILNKSK